jgi:hypothetical protein
VLADAAASDGNGRAKELFEQARERGDTALAAECEAALGGRDRSEVA